MTNTNPALAGVPLVLGGNVFGWTADEKTSFAILDAFVDSGGMMIDTADVYSAWLPGHVGGESETVIGKWLKSSGKRDKVKIATKVGMQPGDGGVGLAPDQIAAACEASLARLGIGCIDLYYAHQDDHMVDQSDVAKAFGALQASGKIAALGASNFTVERLQSALDAGTDYTVLQPEHNLVSRGKMAARIRERRGKAIEYEGALQNLCVAKGIAVLPYFGLASGFLTGKYRSEDDMKGPRAYRVADYMCPLGLATLAAMDQVAADTGASLTQIALAWLTAQPGIAAPIASVSNPAQLTELIAATTLTLSPEHLALLSSAGN
jgi:aryl-alcohol dehydrogenase-like predicted oxidoreductase